MWHGRLKDTVQYPTDCIHVLRSRPFSFSARSCNKWSVGRVILCGDAAHVMPPCKLLVPFVNGLGHTG